MNKNTGKLGDCWLVELAGSEDVSVIQFAGKVAEFGESCEVAQNSQDLFFQEGLLKGRNHHNNSN